MRSGDLRAENRYRILSTLRRDGPLSRAALGERTQLSQAAVSTLTAQLVAEDVLGSGDEPGAPAGGRARARRGRPQTFVALAPDAACALTISLSIDRLRLALVDYRGTETHVRDRYLDTRALAAGALSRSIGDSAARLVRKAPAERISHIGVAFQGTTANGSGALQWSPVIGHRDVPLGTVLSRRFGVPVRVNNDCALIARALGDTHPDVLGESFATVLFTHGIGLGLTLNGQPFAGIRSSALELGHLIFERGGARCRCGRRGCIEAYAADYGIVRLAGDGSLDDAPPGRLPDAALDALVADARDGKAPAVQALAIAGAAIGDGLDTLFTLLDPMPVALVGRCVEALELMEDALHGALAAGGHGATPTVLAIFDDSEPLLYAGTALDTLEAVDRQIAANGQTSGQTSGRADSRAGSTGAGDGGSEDGDSRSVRARTRVSAADRS